MPEFDSTVRYAPIPGFPGYMAGTDGTIWSCWRGRNPQSHMSDQWIQLIANSTERYGHLAVSLYDGTGKRKVKQVARIVLEAFVGPGEPGMEACHFPDRDPANNRLENLRWDTHKGNHADRLFHGTNNAGEKHGMSKTTEKEVREIRWFHQFGVPSYILADRYGLSRGQLSAIISRKAWGHVD